MNMSIITSINVETSELNNLNKKYFNYILSDESNIIEHNFLSIFNHSCNLMKDIETEKKSKGLEIMEKLIKFDE